MTRQQTILREQWWRMAVVFLSLVFGITLLFAVDNLLVSSVLGFVLAYLISPGVTLLERTRIPREVGVIIIFAIFTVVIVLGVQLLTPLLTTQFNELMGSLPHYVRDIKDLLARSETRLNRFIVNYEINLSERVGLYLESKIGSFLESVPSLATKVFTVTLLGPFIAFFIVKDGRTFSRQLLALVPNRYFELFLDLGHQINTQMGAFIRARLLESTIVGLVVWLGLMVLQYPYAVFLALFAAIMNLIPYIGPVIGAIPAFVLAVINKDPSLVVFMVSLVYVIAQLLDMLVIIPMVVARIVNLHPVTVVIVIILGAQVMDVLGMILSIPLTSALKLVFTNVYQRLIVFKVG